MATNNTFTLGGSLEINRMGYGSMRLTGKGIWHEPADENEAINVLQKAIGLGVNFIDTADSYGPFVAENLIAKGLHPYPKDLVIATKGGFERPGPDKWVMNGRPEHLKAALEGSLKRLKLDQIPLYQLHRIDPKVPVDETIGFLKMAQEKGMIKYLGLSEVSVKDIEKVQQQVKIVSVQNKYSLTFREWEPVLNFCEKNDLAFIPWNPIIASRLNPSEELQLMANKYNASPTQVILKWLLRHSSNILLIPGTSSVRHLEENIAAVDVSLSDDDYAALNDLSNANREK